MGNGVFFLVLKRPGVEVGRSPASAAEVKNWWSYTLFLHTPLWRELGQLYV
jgi:hypothetical protein